jgi:hypothetical protein
MDGNREIDRITSKCLRKSLPWERPLNQHDSRCKAQFANLDATSRPPLDLPPSMWKLMVIQDGKRQVNTGTA